MSVMGSVGSVAANSGNGKFNVVEGSALAFPIAILQAPARCFLCTRGCICDCARLGNNQLPSFQRALSK